ncbi:MAG: hypothetical protein METHAR1v1_1500005 [Methanothrix sp.]|jgi:hypothetical protein|nr:MAG: hypothetical protein METHAR1v1_1500005 [Methanothrix sp.]
MTANNFANHPDGHISRVLSGSGLPNPDLRSYSQKYSAFGAFNKMESSIMEITPLYRRGEANV